MGPLQIISLMLGGQYILFYDHNNFGSLLHGSRLTTSCETLPENTWNKAASLKTSNCVILFSHPDCKGTHKRFEKGEHPGLVHFADEADSFRSCDDIREESPYKDVRIQFYSWFGYRLLDSPILPGCTTLPEFARNGAKSVKTGVCVELFSHAHCEGRSVRLEEGEYKEAKAIPYFDADADSFRPCKDSDIIKVKKDKFQNFSVQIKKLAIVEDPDGDGDSAEGAKDMEMGAVQKFYNNGSATISQRYSIKKEIKESAQFERVVGTSEYSKFYVDAEVGFEYSTGVPAVAQAKISASLKTGYSFEKTANESVATSYKNETLKAFEVEQDLQIPPCEMYEVKSVIKIMSDYPMKYVATAHVSGVDHDGKALSTQQIKEKLTSEMVYVKDVNGNTVEVTFERSLTVDFGLTTETYGNGHPISHCGDKGKSRSQEAATSYYSNSPNAFLHHFNTIVFWIIILFGILRQNEYMQ